MEEKAYYIRMYVQDMEEMKDYNRLDKSNMGDLIHDMWETYKLYGMTGVRYVNPKKREIYCPKCKDQIGKDLFEIDPREYKLKYVDTEYDENMTPIFHNYRCSRCGKKWRTTTV